MLRAGERHTRQTATAGIPGALRSVKRPAQLTHRYHHVLRAPADAAVKPGVPSDRALAPPARAGRPERHADVAITRGSCYTVMAAASRAAGAVVWAGPVHAGHNLTTTAVRAIM